MQDAVSQDREAFRFFFEHAGYVVGRRAECALELARAERVLVEAVDAGVASVEWHEEEGWSYGDLGDVDTEEQMSARFESNEWTGPFVALLKVEGETVASCGMIVLGSREFDDPYARVMAAELAAEALDEIRQALGDARDEDLS